MMRQQTSFIDDAPKPSRAADVFVFAAMAMVAVAIAAGLAVQMALPVIAAVAAGFCLFSLFVASHVLAGQPKKAVPQRRPAGQRPMPRTTYAPAYTPPAPEPVTGPDLSPSPAAMCAEPMPQSQPVLPPLSNPVAAEPELPIPHGADPMQTYWSYAPRAPRFEEPMLAPAPDVALRRAPELPMAPSPAASEFPAHAVEAAPRPAVPTLPREEDVEVIQNLIKKLAEEVNASELANAGTIPAAAAPRAPMAAPGVSPRFDASPARDQAIEASLDALRKTADTMRAVSEQAPSAAPLEAAHQRSTFATPAVAVPPPLPAADAQPAPPAQPRATALSEAIAAGRVDVLLEPIMGLGDQRACHYEVTMRLRSVAGETLLAGDGDVVELKGTGLLPLIDAAKIARTASVAARLGERGKDGSVFSSYNGESLTDRGFFAGVASAMRHRPPASGQLILTFSQDDVRAFETPEWAALGDLAALGFGFAIAGVTDLDMDFERLVTAGFSFAKLDADVFLEGLPAPSGVVPASDVCRHLAGLGLTLVVDRIDSELKRARIFGFGVLLGQGQLFGVPRPVKADAVSVRRDAAA